MNDNEKTLNDVVQIPSDDSSSRRRHQHHHQSTSWSSLMAKFGHLRDSTGWLVYVLLVTLASFQLIHMLVSVHFILYCVYNLIRLLMTTLCVVSVHAWLHAVYGSVLNLTEKNVYALFLACVLGELATSTLLLKQTDTTASSIDIESRRIESTTTTTNISTEYFQDIAGGAEHVLVVAFLFLATNYVSYGHLKENTCLVLALGLTRLYGASAFAAILPHSLCVYFTYMCALVGILFSFYLNSLINNNNSNSTNATNNAISNKESKIKYLSSWLLDGMMSRPPANTSQFVCNHHNHHLLLLRQPLSDSVARQSTKTKRNKSKETLYSSTVFSKRRTSLPTIPSNSKLEKNVTECWSQPSQTSDYESGESPTNSDYYNSDTDKLKSMNRTSTAADDDSPRHPVCQYHEMLSARLLQQVKQDLAGLRINKRSLLSSSSAFPPESAKKMWKPSDLAHIDLLDRIDQWSYPIFELYAKSDQNILSHMTYKIFVKTGLFEAFKIPVEPFIEFFTSLENGYLDLAYHNKIHAADVLHACYYLTTQNVPGLVSSAVSPTSKFFAKQRSLDWSKWRMDDGGVVNCIAANMCPLELLALFCSAAMHDYEHPGRNNQFLVATNSPLAMLYNDKSVLENHHAAASWRLLKSAPKYNFLSGLERDEWRRFRTLILENILATDLGRHFAIIDEFNVKVRQTATATSPVVSSRPIDWSNESERLLVSEMILKLADINAPLKSVDLHLAWTDRIVQEFYEQGDEERERDMPISPYMDRASPMVSKLQESFMSVLVGSLCNTYRVSGLMPGVLVDKNGDNVDGDDQNKVFYSEMDNNFKQNYKMWCEKIKQETTTA